MKASELRIGNIIRLNMLGSNRDVVVCGVNIGDTLKMNDERIYYNLIRSKDDKLNTKHSNSWSLIIYAIPTPINEDWLIKLGFGSYDGSLWFITIGGIIFQVNKISGVDEFMFGCVLNISGLINLGSIASIDQLQNKIWSLVGEELNIKLAPEGDGSLKKDKMCKCYSERPTNLHDWRVGVCSVCGGKLNNNN